MTLTLGTTAWCETPSSDLSQKCPDLPRRITGGSIRRWAPIPAYDPLDTVGLFCSGADEFLAQELVPLVAAVRGERSSAALTSRDQLTRRILVSGVEHVVTDDEDPPGPLGQLAALVRRSARRVTECGLVALRLSFDVSSMDDDWMASPAYCLHNIGSAPARVFIDEEGLSVRGTTDAGEEVSCRSGIGRLDSLRDAHGRVLGSLYDVTEIAPGASASIVDPGSLALAGAGRYSLVGAVRLQLALPGIDSDESATGVPDETVSMLAGPMWCDIAVS